MSRSIKFKLSVLLIFTIFFSLSISSYAEKTNDQLFSEAIIDAMTQTDEELYPLYPIKTVGGKVLLCTWHNYPESYPDDETVTTSWGEIFTVTADELFTKANEITTSTDPIMRLRQLMGVEPSGSRTHVTLMWADIDDIFRPTKSGDINDLTGTLDFPAGTSEEHIEWYESQLRNSYDEEIQYYKYPWTGLGYTYDWADNGTDYGLSEYIISPSANVSVVKTYAINDFIDYLRTVAGSLPLSYSLSLSSGAATVTAPRSGDVKVVFASYDSSGSLQDVEIQTVGFEQYGTKTVTPKSSHSGTTLKVMLWDDMNNIKPLDTAK